MPVNDDLGKRMKEFYENRAKTSLIRRMPVAIRVDGRAFHTFTKYLDRPFDKVLVQSMQATMTYLCQNIQGCVLGYQQSDEITLILVDYMRLDSDAWFDYSVQKLCSLAASMATLEFNRKFAHYANTEIWSYMASLVPQSMEYQIKMNNYHIALRKCMEQGAMFDARCFNIPIEEVTNLIYWRQLDATRNSIQMVAQANFSHRELQNLNTAALQDKLMLEKGINWSKDYTTSQKRGCCCIKDSDNKWFIDNEIPIFVGEGREYIERLIQVPADGTH